MDDPNIDATVKEALKESFETYVILKKEATRYSEAEKEKGSEIGNRIYPVDFRYAEQS